MHGILLCKPTVEISEPVKEPVLYGNINLERARELVKKHIQEDNAEVLEAIQKGDVHYHAIEIMACPGECIDGGDRPYHFGNIDVVKKRMEGLYEIDRDKKLRNPMKILMF